MVGGRLPAAGWLDMSRGPKPRAMMYSTSNKVCQVAYPHVVFALLLGHQRRVVS